jgi:hypothetical protein
MMFVLCNHVLLGCTIPLKHAQSAVPARQLIVCCSKQQYVGVLLPPAAGTSTDFPSSGGAVGLVGTGTTAVLERGMSECEPVQDGLTVARCTFVNNTAVISGEC